MKQLDMLYEGKAKKIFRTDQAGQLLMEYKDSLTAFNALKKGEFAGKGRLNCQISTLLFKILQKNGVHHHWIETLNESSMLVHETRIIPLEVVVRNRVAGSLAKKLNMTEGHVLPGPLVEFYYKSDQLGDPFVSDDQIVALGWADEELLKQLKRRALQVNRVLSEVFEKINLTLVDFKTEFGHDLNHQILLADEISPDCMRLWDTRTGEKLDKDRFRRDLGGVEEAYKEVYLRLSGGGFL